jgi:hypothetical protein
MQALCLCSTWMLLHKVKPKFTTGRPCSSRCEDCSVLCWQHYVWPGCISLPKGRGARASTSSQRMALRSKKPACMPAAGMMHACKYGTPITHHAAGSRQINKPHIRQHAQRLTARPCRKGTCRYGRDRLGQPVAAKTIQAPTNKHPTPAYAPHRFRSNLSDPYGKKVNLVYSRY